MLGSTSTRGRSSGQLATINPNAAGLDVGSTFHVVAVPADAALAVLAWHVRTGTKARRTDLVLLAKLIEAFDLLRSRSGETPPVEVVKQRLKRIKGNDYYEKFIVPSRRGEFHTNHCFAAWQSGEAVLRRCGTACFPNAPVEDWWDRDLLRVPTTNADEN